MNFIQRRAYYRDKTTEIIPTAKFRVFQQIFIIIRYWEISTLTAVNTDIHVSNYNEKAKFKNLLLQWCRIANLYCIHIWFGKFAEQLLKIMLRVSTSFFIFDWKHRKNKILALIWYLHCNSWSVISFWWAWRVRRR